MAFLWFWNGLFVNGNGINEFPEYINGFLLCLLFSFHGRFSGCLTKWNLVLFFLFSKNYLERFAIQTHISIGIIFWINVWFVFLSWQRLVRFFRERRGSENGMTPKRKEPVFIWYRKWCCSACLLYPFYLW